MKPKVSELEGRHARELQRIPCQTVVVGSQTLSALLRIARAAREMHLRGECAPEMCEALDAFDWEEKP